MLTAREYDMYKENYVEQVFIRQKAKGKRQKVVC